MSKELVLICNEDGKWQAYESDHSIVIVCANQEEQDRACEILSKIGTDDDLRDAIFTNPVAIAAKLKAYCGSKDQNCGGCAFNKSGRCPCAIRRPNGRSRRYSRMDEEMTGLFRCRNCGAVFEEKVDVARSVSWAIKDITENLGGDGITSVFHRTSLPERFVLHWCKRDKVCICNLIGWKVGKEAQDDG